MAIEVVPTLAFMAEVYRSSTEGGPSSDRFRRYTDAAREHVPVHGYNPMTSKPVLATVEALLAIDAEALVASAANRTAAVLGFAGDATMHLTVATPGMWTDRLATEVAHRLDAPDPGGVLHWFDDLVTAADVEAAAVAQTVRLVLVARSGRPATLVHAVDQEGRALAMSGEPGRLDDAAADALAVLADDPTRSTMAAYLWGDDAARALGYTPLGLGDHVGYDHAAALAARVLR